MAVTKLPMPSTEAAGTVTVVLELAPLAVKSPAPMTASTTFCTRKETVPVGAGPVAPPRTVAVRRTVSFHPACGGSAPCVSPHGVVPPRLRWIGRDGGGAGRAAVPLGHQVVGVDRAETGGQVVSRTGRVTHQALHAVRTAQGAAHGVVARGDVVEYVVGGLGQAVERRVDVAQSRFGQQRLGSEVLIEQRHHAGHGRRASRSAADDIKVAVQIDLVARMVGGGGEGNVGDVARLIVGHAGAGLPVRLWGKKAE